MAGNDFHEGSIDRYPAHELLEERKKCVSCEAIGKYERAMGEECRQNPETGPKKIYELEASIMLASYSAFSFSPTLFLEIDIGIN